MRDANGAFDALVGCGAGSSVGSSLVEVVAASQVDAGFDGDVAARCAAALASDGPTSFGSAGEHLEVYVAEGGDDRRLVLVAGSGGGPAGASDPWTLDLASRDELTGLGNRRMLNQILEGWPAGEPIALLMIDLDRFKAVNDSLGHPAGDKLLTLVADRIGAAVRKNDDRVCRIGGDEFLVVHTPDEAGSADKVAQRIVEFVGRPFLIEGQQVNTGASVGVAHLDDTSPIDALLRHADLALHAAKSAGRGCVQMFDSSLQVRADQRRERELRLRRALGLGELSVVYQPQVAVTEHRVSGFEALLRWYNPALGHVPPSEFIPLAEETGEIHRIGEWVLQTACDEARRWPDGLVVAVNVSAVQFSRDTFVGMVADVLAQSGLSPERLELEITESVLLEQTAGTAASLWELRDLGVRVALDDFGTGYSSLSYLNSFPFSTIKIDQSFIRGEKTDRSEALVRSIVTLGSSLGMTTVAEGVETDEHYRELVEQGCSEVQGYFFAKPMSCGDIEPFLRRPLPTQRTPSAPGPQATIDDRRRTAP